MKLVRVFGSLDNLVRPLIYIGGEADLWIEEWVDLLHERSGSILLSGSYVENSSDVTFWNHAAWQLSDIVSYWFDRDTCFFESVMELGMVLGRFMVGSGPKRLVVTAEPHGRMEKALDFELGVLNKVLVPGWRIYSGGGLRGHYEKMLSALERL